MLTPYIPKPKPPFPYDRPLSHSQLSSFEWNPRQWYEKYVLGEEKDPSPELIFGKMVDEKFQKDPSFLPEVPRLTYLQYELKCTYKGIELIGFPDMLDLEKPQLRDLKSGRKKWDKKRADQTLQLTMYLFMIYLIHKISPEKFECYIDWVETHYHDKEIVFVDNMVPKAFKTKRTLVDILKFGNYIEETRAKMVKYYEQQR